MPNSPSSFILELFRLLFRWAIQPVALAIYRGAAVLAALATVIAFCAFVIWGVLQLRTPFLETIAAARRGNIATQERVNTAAASEVPAPQTNPPAPISQVPSTAQSEPTPAVDSQTTQYLSPIPPHSSMAETAFSPLKPQEATLVAPYYLGEIGSALSAPSLPPLEIVAPAEPSVQKYFRSVVSGQMRGRYSTSDPSVDHIVTTAGGESQKANDEVRSDYQKKFGPEQVTVAFGVDRILSEGGRVRVSGEFVPRKLRTRLDAALQHKAGHEPDDSRLRPWLEIVMDSRVADLIRPAEHSKVDGWPVLDFNSWIIIEGELDAWSSQPTVECFSVTNRRMFLSPEDLCVIRRNDRGLLEIIHRDSEAQLYPALNPD